MKSLNSDPRYPNRRAFVLKMHADANPAVLAGRLENLVTGRRLEFRSSRELLDSLASELEQPQAGDQPE